MPIIFAFMIASVLETRPVIQKRASQVKTEGPTYVEIQVSLYFEVPGIFKYEEMPELGSKNNIDCIQYLRVTH